MLLENNNILPLTAGSRVLLTGPAADSRRLLCGGWTNHWQGPVDDSPSEFPHQQPTISERLTELHGSNVITQPGITLAHRNSTEPANTHDSSGVAAALGVAAGVDVVVLVFGEEVYAEKPGDIEDLELPLILRNYAKSLIATGTVLHAGTHRCFAAFLLLPSRPLLLAKRDCVLVAAGGGRAG